MALTPKQEKFAQLVASGTNQSDAYRQAYNAENMTYASVNRQAHAVAQNSNVASRVKELQKPIIEAHRFTLDSYIKRMNELCEISLSAEDNSAAIKALENVGKVLGFYTQKTEISGRDGGPLDIQLVKRIIKK